MTKTERDVITKRILPALKKSGWNLETQIQEEVYFTKGRVFVKGKKTVRGESKRADIILYYKPNIPVALIEAKEPNLSLGSGMQQAIGYGEILDVPVVYSSNGSGFLEHDFSGYSEQIEKTIPLEKFPSPEELWERYKHFKGIVNNEQEKIASYEYFFDPSGKTPRYFQRIAINRTVEAIAKGQQRILLVMATGTGKTFTAFHIIYRLWKSGTKKRILFLADRNALIDQTKRNDFKHFKEKMTVIRKKHIDKAFEIFLALYQGLTNYNEDKDAFRKFSRDFFDLVIVDECHRGSASADSAWREILDYFSSATHIGLTATPKETKDVSNIEYFGEPIYTYSLKQGIEDGFLAPYKVIRVGLNVDLEGWRPDSQTKDIEGRKIEDREYNLNDFDKNLVIDERTLTVSRKITEYLRNTNTKDKTIIFCVDIEHAERMRQALVNENPEEVRKSNKYVMRITGDDPEGKREVDNFINPEETYPVIATTSKLLTTGIDAQTCKLIVLESNIQSMTEFKQIIGRGTRINEEHGKYFFTIMDFRNVTRLFADPAFDGTPVMEKVVQEDEIIDEGIIDEELEKDIFDPETGMKIEFDTPDEEVAEPELVFGEEKEKKQKIYIAGVDVSILNEQVRYIDEHGKLITESLIEYTKKGLRNKFRSLNEFLSTWSNADKKKTLINELDKQGMILENLKDDVKKDLDIFDLICHVAFDMPALTRKERADKVKKKNYFSKYGEKAQKVLESLLDKYAEVGIDSIEDISVLRISPINQYGTPIEIINSFGGKDEYLKAIKELEHELYKVAS